MTASEQQISTTWEYKLGGRLLYQAMATHTRAKTSPY